MATNAFGVDLGLFVLGSCRLERVTPGNTPAAFPVGTDGGACGGLASPTSCSPHRAGEINRSASDVTPDDPRLGRYGAFSCGSLRL